MLLFGGVLTLIALGVWLFSLFDVLTTDEADVRRLPKFAWFLIVLFGFDIGAIIWLIFGRPRIQHRGADVRSWSPHPTPPDDAGQEPPKGPEDDPEFLRNLERRLRGEDPH
jgi:hypothetical protein